MNRLHYFFIPVFFYISLHGMELPPMRLVPNNPAIITKEGQKNGEKAKLAVEMHELQNEIAKLKLLVKNSDDQQSQEKINLLEIEFKSKELAYCCIGMNNILSPKPPVSKSKPRSPREKQPQWGRRLGINPATKSKTKFN